MNILITGCSGFVGSHLAPLLLKAGHTVVGLSHQSGDSEWEQRQVDLLDEEAMAAVDLRPFDAVIHLAGLAAVGPSFKQPRRYIDANAGMQINLFETLIAQNRTPRVLVISSASLYGDPKLPLTEGSAVVANNPYAVSKLTQEHLGQYYGKRGFEVIIARPFNHIGPGQAEGFLVSDLAKQVVAAEQPGAEAVIKVGDLSSCRDYTDVRDIVKAYAGLLQDGRPGEIYNVCSGVSTRGQDILDGLMHHSSAHITVETDAARMRPSDNPDMYGSFQKLHADTGWEPIIDIEQTLADVLEDWRHRAQA